MTQQSIPVTLLHQTLGIRLEGYQWDGEDETFGVILDWSRSSRESATVTRDGSRLLAPVTPHSKARLQVAYSDWLVVDEQRRFRVLGADEVRQHYRKA